MLKTYDEMRDHLQSVVRDTQLTSLFGSFLNLTLQEIHDYAPWTWLRRKQTFATVASQEDYNLDEEVERIALLREITTSTRLMYFPDSIFYREVPDPENSSGGIPAIYRLWEETGFSTNLAAADTIQVLSSSASDTSSFNVVVVGRESTNNTIVAETITLNGVTAVTSSNTWAASGLMSVSKSGQTTGHITVRRTTGATTLSIIAPEETSPRYKRLSLYPVPTSVLTMYMEYYERLRLLVNDTDVPQMDHRWTWVLIEGALAKCWEYKQNEAAYAQHYQAFLRGLDLMKKEDAKNYDYIPVIQARAYQLSQVRRVNDSISSAFPSYSLNF